MKKLVTYLLIFSSLMMPLTGFAATENQATSESAISTVPTYEFTAYEYRSDFEVLKDVLEKNHGFLYENISKEKFEKKFNELAGKINEKTSLNEFFGLVMELLDTIGDGHTYLNFNNYADQIYDSATYLPLSIKIFDTKIYSNASYNDIPLGSEIVSIDGHKSKDILKKMATVAASETSHDRFANFALEGQFHILYPLYYGMAEHYTVRYIDINDGKEKSIDLVSKAYDMDKISQFPHSSYISGSFGYAQAPLQAEFDAKTKTATLRIYTFMPSNSKYFMNYVDNFFKRVADKKYENVIFDVRGNTGGEIALVDHILSYVAPKNGNTIYSEVLNPRVFGRSNLIKDPNYEGILEEFSRLFKLTPEERKEEEIIALKGGAVGMLYPEFEIQNENHFAGKTYVLMDEGSFSCGSIFPQKIMELCGGIGVGTITSGNYYETTAGTLPTFKLPNTEFEVSVPLLRLIIENKKNITIASNEGVEPTHLVGLSYEDFLNGVDTQLEYVHQLIQKSAKK